MASARSSPLLVRSAPMDDAVVVRMTGVLDSTTYHLARDAVVKAALEVPRAVLVVVDGLEAESTSAWAVFTSARWHVHEWPDVPIFLVCGDAVVRRTLARLSIGRYVPVHPTLSDARTAVEADDLNYRRRSSRVLTAGELGLRIGHRFVDAVLSSWLMADRIPVATMVAHAFMENAVVHSGSAEFTLRLETDGVTVVVAVSDGAPAPAVRLERAASDPVPRGLDVVAALTTRWGCSPTVTGKTVWATLRPGADLSPLAALF